MPESTLVERCIASDRSAQRELYHAYRRRAHRTLYRILGSNVAMDDLLQEVFVNVFRSLPTYRGESSLGVWIDRIAVRVAYAHISDRTKAHAPLELVRDVPSEEPSAERQAFAREAVRRLYAQLARMDPKLHVAFSLHVIDDRPLAEVAQLMDATVVATKTRVWRARRELWDRAKRDPALADLVHDLDASAEKADKKGETA
jgi:RNA polymerase sigma-70 factor (ECF subfamily)